MLKKENGSFSYSMKKASGCRISAFIMRSHRRRHASFASWRSRKKTNPSAPGSHVPSRSPKVWKSPRKVPWCTRLRNTAIGNLLKLAPHSEAIHKIGREFGLTTGIIPDGCIRCRLCIRVCSEIIGAKALKMVKMEGRSYVSPSDKGECIGCLTCTNVCPTKAIRYEDDGNIRTVMVRDEIVGRHTLERCQICGKLYSTTKFLEHVKQVDADLPEEKEDHRHCPTCSKLYYRKNLKMTAPKLATLYGNKPVA